MPAVVLLIGGFVAVVVPVAASAEAMTSTTSFTQPFTRLLTFPCLDERVLLEGTVHVVLHTTVDANGGVLTTRHTQPMGVTGVGLVTGTIYHGTGVTERITNAGPPPSEFTIVNNFKVIGEGGAPNSLIHQLVHVTTNANGEPTAEIEQEEIECGNRSPRKAWRHNMFAETPAASGIADRTGPRNEPIAEGGAMNMKRLALGALLAAHR